MDDGDEKMSLCSQAMGYTLPLFSFSNLFLAPSLSIYVYFSYVNVLKMKCSLDQQHNNKFNGIRN